MAYEMRKNSSNAYANIVCMLMKMPSKQVFVEFL